MIRSRYTIACWLFLSLCASAFFAHESPGQSTGSGGFGNNGSGGFGNNGSGGFGNNGSGGFGNSGSSGGTGNGSSTSGTGATGEIPQVNVDAAFATGIQREQIIGATSNTAPVFSNQTNSAYGYQGRGGSGIGGAFGGAFGNAFGQAPGGTGQGQEQSKTIRIRLRSDIEVAAPRVESRQNVISSHLHQNASAARVQSVRVELSGRTAVLTGSVATERDKRLAANLVRLEPGVSKIDNRLVVRDSREPLSVPAPTPLP